MIAYKIPRYISCICLIYCSAMCSQNLSTILIFRSSRRIADEISFYIPESTAGDCTAESCHITFYGIIYKIAGYIS